MNKKSSIILLFSLLLFFIISTKAFSQDIYQPEIPNNIASQFTEARSLRQQGQTAESIAKLKSIIQRYPDYFLANYNLALAYSDSNNNMKAIELFKKTLEIKERKNIPEATIYNSLGVTYIETGDYTNAEKMLKLGEQNINILSTASKKKLYNNLGVLYLYKGNYAESEKYFRIIDNDPKAKNNLKILEDIKADVETKQQMQQKR